MNKKKTHVVRPLELNVRAKLTTRGLDIIVNQEHFPITYPKEIWQAYPQSAKEILMDNLAYSATIFLPQMLGLGEITYQTARPLSEVFLFKNAIYDTSISAIDDKQSSVSYLKSFFNTQFIFASARIKVPSTIHFKKTLRKKRTALVPFCFGKESLLTMSLCQEIGVRPILIYCVEPANTYEYHHKKKLIKEFKLATGRDVYVVNYQPGIFRSGRHWNLNTDLGWGLHTTDYVLLMLPFAHYFKADYLLLGNEQQCSESFINTEGLLTFIAAYDQHHDWTPQQALLASLLLGRRLEVGSLVDPLYELAITKILHHRYSDIARFQMSCLADNDKARQRRWCQSCSKCVEMFAYLSAFGFDFKKVGFTLNLFDRAHYPIYRSLLFQSDPLIPLTSYCDEETELSLYLATLHGCHGYTLERFRTKLLPLIVGRIGQLTKKYLGIHPTSVIPGEIKDKVLQIFREELKEFLPHD